MIKKSYVKKLNGYQDNFGKTNSCSYPWHATYHLQMSQIKFFLLADVNKISQIEIILNLTRFQSNIIKKIIYNLSNSFEGWTSCVTTVTTSHCYEEKDNIQKKDNIIVFVFVHALHMAHTSPSKRPLPTFDINHLSTLFFTKQTWYNP